MGASRKAISFMQDMINRQFYLASRPDAAPTPEEVPFRDVPLREPEQGEVVIRNMYISLDPAIRGWMSDVSNYIEPIGIGEPIRSSVIGRVVKSNSDQLSEGDVVLAVGAWERYTTAQAAAMTRLDEAAGIPLSSFLGILGPTGLTAYFGLLDVGKPQAGETVLVSAAAGAVGSTVGQIAKLKGCRVVGIAGSDDKCAWITEELGFDDAINYKTCGDLEAAIKGACPQGVDIYFDNVGGDILDAALMCMNKHARIAVCGWISTYNEADAPGPRNLWQMVAKSLTVQGFVVLDYVDRFTEGVEQLAGWLMAGKLQYREEIVDDLDNILPTFLKLFDGSNQGKLITRIPEESV
ncbi:NADP-dependent oxidoreductase [Microbulbifer agarilyticus]|uniref:NADP-dependent oxidoreductase n=1 Tax=Microbulbifer agarilyticus TaxID=260552 RepID=UPI001CD58934|nr:NADP-dependent oxidoreductase [Microbulbifer agarilyticus]MCA0900543.1 NADP-dependent oxidoreductase [Microbulbifer agarilyticus]